MAPTRNPLGDVYDPFADDVPVRELDAPPPRRTMAEVSERMATPRGALARRIIPPKDDELHIYEDGTIGYGPFHMADTGLLPPTGVITQEWWTKFGHVLKKFEGSIAWLIGDWFNTGETEWGVSYSKVADYFGYEVSTLWSYASIARSVNSLIRIKELSFAHHRLVATFEVDEQRGWLEIARDEKLTLAAFKERIYGKKEATLPADVKDYRKRARKLDAHFAGKKTLPLADAERAIQDQMRFWAERLELVRQQMAGGRR